jgi:hypothetical protein
MSIKLIAAGILTISIGSTGAYYWHINNPLPQKTVIPQETTSLTQQEVVRIHDNYYMHSLIPAKEYIEYSRTLFSDMPNYAQIQDDVRESLILLKLSREIRRELITSSKVTAHPDIRITTSIISLNSAWKKQTKQLIVVRNKYKFALIQRDALTKERFMMLSFLDKQDTEILEQLKSEEKVLLEYYSKFLK